MSEEREIEYFVSKGTKYIILKDGSKGYIDLPPTPDQVTKNINKLRSMYHKRFAFPEWVAQVVSDDIVSLLKTVRVYYPNDCSVNDAKTLFTKREPTNILGDSLYNQTKFNAAYGWKHGEYTEMSNNIVGKLPPNIAVFTPSLVDVNDQETLTWVNIINSIGIALDNPQQPDYIMLMSLPKIDRIPFLQQAYYGIFLKIFQCAHDMELTSIVMSLVGAFNFAKLYPRSGGNNIVDEKEKARNIAAFREEVWIPSFVKAYQTAVSMFSTKPNIMFMGTDSGLIKDLLQPIFEFVDIGHFPENILKVDTKITLFVNAWDPLSIPGNGNAGDNSLDGHVGRVSTIAATGNGITNPHATFVQMRNFY